MININLQRSFPFLVLDKLKGLTTLPNKKCKQVERTFGSLIRGQFFQTMEYSYLYYIYDEGCDRVGPVEICKQKGDLNLTDLVEDKTGGCTYRQSTLLIYIRIVS